MNPFLCKRLQARKQNKTKQRQLIKQRDYSNMPNTGQKFPRYFSWYLKFLAIFKNVYEFILGFLAGPPPMFCGALTGTHWNTGCLAESETRSQTLQSSL